MRLFRPNPSIVRLRLCIAALHRRLAPRNDAGMAKTQGSTESDELGPREPAFVEQCLLSANGAKAAETAGYAGKSAIVRARRLLRRPRVIAAIKRAQDASRRARQNRRRARPRGARGARLLEHRALRDRSDCRNRSVAPRCSARGDASRRVDQASRNAWCERQHPRA